jgi:hypothetical protein
LVVDGSGSMAQNKLVGLPSVKLAGLPAKDTAGPRALCYLDAILWVKGDATDEAVLELAGIYRARGLVAALHNDPENVFVTLTARQLNPGLQIVARASEKGTEAKLLRAGADRVISPFEIAGRRDARCRAVQAHGFPSCEECWPWSCALPGLSCRSRGTSPPTRRPSTEALTSRCARGRRSSSRPRAR